MDEDFKPQNTLLIKPIFIFALRLYQSNFLFFLTFGLMYAFVNVLDGFLSQNLGIQSKELFLLINITLNAWITIALTHICLQAYAGAEADIKGAFLKANGIFIRYIAVMLSKLFLVGSGILLFIIPGIYFSVIFAMTEMLVVIERSTYQEAFIRSAQIVKPYFWQVLLFNMILAVCLLGPSLIVYPIIEANAKLGNTLNSFLLAIIFPFYMLAQIGLYNKIKDTV